MRKRTKDGEREWYIQWRGKENERETTRWMDRESKAEREGGGHESGTSCARKKRRKEREPDVSLALALLFEARARSVARACDRTCVRAYVCVVRKEKEEPPFRALPRAFLFSLFDQCHLVIWTFHRVRERNRSTLRDRISAEKRECVSFLSIDRSRGLFDSELLHPLSCERDLGSDCGERRKRQNGKSVRAKGSRRGQSGRKVNCALHCQISIANTVVTSGRMHGRAVRFDCNLCEMKSV